MQTQIQKLENDVESLKSKEIKDLKVVFSHLRILPVDLVMDGFTAKKRDERSWSRKPFYTHPQGYKMTLSVKPEGSHLTAFIYIIEGEYDNQLEWPYRGTIVIQLLHQEDTKKYVIKLLSFNNAPVESVRRVTEYNTNTGWGFPQFITYAELTKYVKSDSLCFKVSCPPAAKVAAPPTS